MDGYRTWEQRASLSHEPTYARQDTSHTLLMGYLLWLFGFMGMHRFYYGKKITGTIWFFTAGLLGIGWLIDLVLIPRMEREADFRYVRGPIDYDLAWAFLAIAFLGVFGVHRFYMGKWVTGIVWLFTGGLLFMGWLYDLWTLNEQITEINSRDALRPAVG